MAEQEHDTGGSYVLGDLRFPSELWDTAQRDLQVARQVMSDIAHVHSLRLLGDLVGRFPWPAQRLQARGSGNFEIRLMLNPEVLEDGKIYYVLATVVSSRRMFKGRRESIQLVARYSQEMVADADLMRRDLYDAIRAMARAG